MVTENKESKPFSFKSFLEQYHVVIPMVQRDYAQGRTTDDVTRVRNRFLDAIKSYLVKSEDDNDVMKMDFIYGEKELVWSTTTANKLEKIIVTPLDGQQRLTTLYLLHWYAAKKGVVEASNYEFLNNFTYDIRPSSRDFCSHLLQYVPDWSLSFHDQLVDQNWFMGEWLNDPTVIGMLVMLDSINDKFGNIANLWEILTGEKARIVFYFLPLSENGLSDELYIKMNSRGKKLTAFEHFKAEYEDLYEKDSDEARTVNHKFDVEWADTFFPYRNQDDIVDNEFMKYFFYVSHILCYEQGIKKSNDEFELIKLVYSDSPNAVANRNYLEDAFDCWYRVMKDYGSIDNFFAKYLSGFTYEKGKVTTFKSVYEYFDTQNFFHACVKLYQVNNNFSYSDFLFLYGIITYLINKDAIKEDEFIDRLRTLRNLIWNSNSGEIRGDADYMKDMLCEVKDLMLAGVINKELSHKFNGIQIDEEIEKKEKKQEIDIEKLHKFEDHPLIYGYASGLGYDNLGLVDTFVSLFDSTPEFVKIHRAMLAIDNYMQTDSSRYYMGNHNRSTWSQLLHKSRNRNNFEKTMAVLRMLLQRIKNGESLDIIINKYLSEKEEEQTFDWRYYFVKYPDMLRGADGELTWDDSNDYICTTLNKHQFNGQHWNPFLNVIYQNLSDKLRDKDGNEIIRLENYGDDLNILKPIASIGTTGTGFIYYHQDTSQPWDVEQENSLDKVDRVAFAITKIKKIVQENLNERTQS
uniref:GmrSD restriction endonuclease domain-containing protein n=1 Tax=Prevotella sp. TaxID=59823 RepID=UPI0040252B1C